MDSQFKKAVMEGSTKMYMCERHFKGEDIECIATGIQVLKLQALPSLNFPEKSKSKVKEGNSKENRRNNVAKENNFSTMITQNFAKELRSVNWKAGKCT